MPSFLKNLGKILSTASTLIPVYGPLIGALIPGTKDDVIIAGAADRIDGLISVVTQAEVMGQAIQAPGAQKAAMAAPAILQILLSSKLVAGKKPKDAAAAKAAAENVGKALADFLNAFED